MSKSTPTIPTMEEDLTLFDMCIDMLKNPNSSSKLVRETMCASLLIIQDRVEALDSPVLSLEISEDEYNQHLEKIFVKYDVMRYKHLLLADF